MQVTGKENNQFFSFTWQLTSTTAFSDKRGKERIKSMKPTKRLSYMYMRTHYPHQTLEKEKLGAPEA